MYLWLLNKIVGAVFSIHALPWPKVELLNLDIHQFSYNERLIHSKWHLRRSLCIEFKENPMSHFLLKETLPKPKIGLPNLGFHQFFRSINDRFIQKGI